MNTKKTIAVMFGGMSAEHDVSILTGLQIIDSFDSTKYDVFPLYIAQDGNWFTGKALLNRKNYPLDNSTIALLDKVQLRLGNGFENKKTSRFSFVSTKNPLFGCPKIYEFDAVMPAFHGTLGEDGSIQGMFELAGIPYAGFRVLGAAVYMDKAFSKKVFSEQGLPYLKTIIVNRPKNEGFIDFKALLKNYDIKYPVCCKPCNLGSSVGVSKASNEEELIAGLAAVFKLDNTALVEPFVTNLVEYNVSVTSVFGETTTSAIEKPMKKEAFLDFKDKYLSSTEIASKLDIPSEGMAGAIRDLNPQELSKDEEKLIRDCAVKAFDAVGGKGVVRVDFLCDGDTREIYINEVNTFPGSLSCYLWEAASPKVIFSDILDKMMIEAFALSKEQTKIVDPSLANSSVFKKK
ncbi:MAG: hypothetical protein AB7U85_10470 [Alphaproteobacteria bacterium]